MKAPQFLSTISLTEVASATKCTLSTFLFTARRVASSSSSCLNWYLVLCRFQSFYLLRNLTTASCVWAEILTRARTVFSKPTLFKNVLQLFHLTIVPWKWESKGSTKFKIHRTSLTKIKQIQVLKQSTNFSDSETNLLKVLDYTNMRAVLVAWASSRAWTNQE